MALKVLDGVESAPSDSNFVSLGVASFLAEANDDQHRHLYYVAKCGESERGQQMFRDFILSFKLSRSIIGVRRTALLTRKSNALANRTDGCADVLAEAHQAAMRGTLWTWEHDDNELNKMCALLAGLAICTFNAGDEIRTADVFAGRVLLPFLKTPSPGVGAHQLVLIAHTHEWVVCHTDKRGTMHVDLRARGFGGMCDAVELFRRKLRV
jgi:hypothetical protein